MNLLSTDVKLNISVKDQDNTEGRVENSEKNHKQNDIRKRERDRRTDRQTGIERQRETETRKALSRTLVDAKAHNTHLGIRDSSAPYHGFRSSL